MMAEDFLVVVPTRGRPQSAVDFMHNFYKTIAGNTSLVFALDDADPFVDAYAENIGDEHLLYCPTSTMVDALNYAANWWFNPKYIGFMGDDHRPRTYGWDVQYMNALDKLGTGIVYGDDKFQGRNLPTQVAMTVDIVRALGYMAPPCLTHLYVDDFWKLLGNGADCLEYLPDVVIEHCHPLAKKSEWDSGYARVNSQEMYNKDARAFGEYVKTQLDSDIVKVRALR